MAPTDIISSEQLRKLEKIKPFGHSEASNNNKIDTFCSFSPSWGKWPICELSSDKSPNRHNHIEIIAFWNIKVHSFLPQTQVSPKSTSSISISIKADVADGMGAWDGDEGGEGWAANWSARIFPNPVKTDVTLADEDTNSILTDNVNVAMHVTQPGGQICNQC